MQPEPLPVQPQDVQPREEQFPQMLQPVEPLDEQFKTEEWKVRGCQSQVWLLPSRQGDKIHFRGDSDAVIVKGLIAIVLMIYSDKSPSEIKAVAVEDIFAKLGLGEHLSPSRRNGLIAMTEKIKYYAGIL